ncbi:MAG: NAD(P)(+) transhydrogenase (Re/Si-specific) subunit alpha [Euryarchaeota archaeon]|nr:NAD(P)(+) transhydrogenase (Re/Si-specific) subunit alpha [Euryarchaeota archaeon]
MMRLGVLKEPHHENRVSIVPATVKKLLKMGFDVVVEQGAGLKSHYMDEDYVEFGAILSDTSEVLSCDIIVSISMPDISKCKFGQLVVCVADPFRNPNRVNLANEIGITLISMDMIPRRLSRAQSMDVNSSQDNLAGYKAVLMGAANVPRGIPMMTTSAGTVKPSKFVIMGSGVAGLQAIATAKRLGAIVYASDVRKSAAEQIESVGGRFIEVDGMDDFEDESGYAKPLTPEFIQKVNDSVCDVARDADVIVTTARIFGRPAPITVPSSAISNFKSGSVVVDMNADVGGNCELTAPGEIIETENGVKIVGTLNLAGELSSTASMLYSNNMNNFIATLVDDGKIVIDLEDDILVGAPEGDDFHIPGMGGVLLCHEGETHVKQSKLKEML